MRNQRTSSCASLLALSIGLALGGSASCTDHDDRKDVPATSAGSGAQDAGAGAGADAGAGAGAGGALDPDPVHVQVKGSAQKGPLSAGSSVTVYGLDSALEPTGTGFPSQTEDGLGSFDVSANLTEGFIEVVAQGPFYDELTRYVEDQSIRASSEDATRGRAVGFTMAMLQRRMASTSRCWSSTDATSPASPAATSVRRSSTRITGSPN